MNNENLKKDFIDKLMLSYRKEILSGVVNGVSPNGLWLTSSCGIEVFIPRSELELMRDLVANFF